MRGFVRFRPVQEADAHNPAAPPRTLYVAWFEPQHYVTLAAAPFFYQRFADMRWAILTPWRSLHWQPADAAHLRGQLHVAPGSPARQLPPPDASEALWLPYYRSSFNPARLKTAALHRGMPQRYWPNLPEAAASPGLQAQGRGQAAARGAPGWIDEGAATLPPT